MRTEGRSGVVEGVGSGGAQGLVGGNKAIVTWWWWWWWRHTVCGCQDSLFHQLARDLQRMRTTHLQCPGPISDHQALGPIRKSHLDDSSLSTHSPNKQLLGTLYVPGSMLGTGLSDDQNHPCPQKHPVHGLYPPDTLTKAWCPPPLLPFSAPASQVLPDRTHRCIQK